MALEVSWAVLLIEIPVVPSIIKTGGVVMALPTINWALFLTVIVPVIHTSPKTVTWQAPDTVTLPVILVLAAQVLVPLLQPALAAVMVVPTAAFWASRS